MSSTQKPQLLRSAPYFPVADVGQCSSYYERVLGFQCEYSAGAPAQFAIMSRDGFAIMFRLVSEPDRISPNGTQGGTWDAFFWTRDVDALHTELRDRGAEIVYGPTFQPIRWTNSLFAIVQVTCLVLGRCAISTPRSNTTCHLPYRSGKGKISGQQTTVYLHSPSKWGRK
ncbi:MAG: VOC family protein [Acidobacteriota bacterium]